MKTDPFNICPNCIFIDTCVLTNQNSSVWQCSECEEGVKEVIEKITKTAIKQTECQLETAMASYKNEGTLNFPISNYYGKNFILEKPKSNTKP